MVLAQNNHTFRCWFTYERRKWIALVMAAVLSGFAWGNGHTTQNAIEHATEQAGCEHYRADKAIKVAKQGIDAATTFRVNPPDPKALPVDNCPH